MDKIEEVKNLLWILDSKHNVSIPQTKENIDFIAGEIVKLFCQPDVNNNEALGSGVGVAVCYHTNAYEVEGGWKYCPDCGVKYIVVAN